MTEEQIEHIAEREMDILDLDLLNGNITQEEYDSQVRDLELWCREQYKQGLTAQ